ncbi:MAG: ABC transporter substrate-binding protein [Candidatus Verstraetearchaeota archaeon]|nr:ABC transporter substrate-binding protein [Candidatus Verstraetearchaeota archaeon]
MASKILIVSVIALIVIVGAGIYFSGFLFPQQTATVRVGHLTGDLHHLALFVARNQGYFEQSGIKIELKEYANGPLLMQDFLAGELDFAYVGAPPAISARAKGMSDPNAHLPVVIASVNLEGSAIVVDGSIESPEDLSGKIIGTPGTGTIQDILLSMYIRDHNLTLTKSPMSISYLPIEFSKGTINGFIGWEPAPSIAVVQSGAHVLLTSKDLFENHQCCVLVVSNKFLASHQDLVSKFAAAHKLANNYIINNPAYAKQLAMNITGHSSQLIDLALSHIVYTSTPDPVSMKTFLHAMIDLNVVTTLTHEQVDDFINAFIDTRFI